MTMRGRGLIAGVLLMLAAWSLAPRRGVAQAALLLEEPYGVYGIFNPAGHSAMYFARVCADTPTHLRRCQPGELGVILSRYREMGGYDWVAMPILPYLFAVDSIDQAPERIDHDSFERLREDYHSRHLLVLGSDIPVGNFLHGGWGELVGASYQRKIYTFRFATTPQQDDRLIAWLNAQPNHTRFNTLFNNCSDFARTLLNFYFPHSFRRSIFPDAGVTTPKTIFRSLLRYGHRHPEVGLEFDELPQIPGNRRSSHGNKGFAESLATTAYVIPIALMNPYVAVGLATDYVARGRYRRQAHDPRVIEPSQLPLWAANHDPQPSVTAPAPSQPASGSGAKSGTSAQDEAATPRDRPSFKP